VATHAADDLVERDFVPSAPDQLWVADIAYIPTAAGLLYLAAVVDCYSRRVVGWSMRDDLRTARRRRARDGGRTPPPRTRPRPPLRPGLAVRLLDFRRALPQSGHRDLNGRRSAYDNAVAESTRAEARRAVFDYIETFYNTMRLHSTLDSLSPVEYEEQAA
jgi:putative transposase